VFHMDVAKVDSDVSYVAMAIYMLQASVQNVSSVSNVCCRWCFIWMLHVSHIFYKCVFQMLQLFQTYVASSVFMSLVFLVFKHILLDGIAKVTRHCIRTWCMWISACTDGACMRT
jgi:hypothetical protein